jgi:F-type H+-transporting ATPase subunit a
VILLNALPFDSHGGEETGGFEKPGVHDFEFEPLFGTDFITKPMLQLVISLIFLSVVFLWWSRNLQVVPTKKQFLLEMIYDFVRNGIARPAVGHDYRTFTPFLFSIFILVAVNNWFGEFFYFMFPTFSNIGFTMGVAALVYVVYIGAGFWKHGFKFLRLALLPPGVPLWLAPLMAPVELISTFVTRPITLTIRLFANMFAGHLGVLVFVTGGAYILTSMSGALNMVGGVGAWLLGIALIGLELFISGLQAYIFTTMAAQYIGSSVAEGH